MKRAAAAILSAALLTCGALLVRAQEGSAAEAAPAEPRQPSRAELGKKALEIVSVNLKSKDSEVRVRAAEVLGLAGNPSVRPALEKMMQDPDKYVRIAAAGAVWELGSPAGLKVLYAIINDSPKVSGESSSPLDALKVISRNKIREKAIEKLASMRGEKAAATLAKLKDDDHGSIRDAAARELARLGRKPELSQFLDALASEEEPVRYEAAVSLGRVCAKEAVRPLTELVSSEKSVRVRVAALEALKCSPGKQAAAAELLKLADDQNPTLRHRAVAALGGIRENNVKAKLKAVAAETTDIRLKLAARKGLADAGEPPDADTAYRALSAVSAEVRLEALEFTETLPAEDSLRLLSTALDDESQAVRLAAALQTIRRFAKK